MSPFRVIVCILTCWIWIPLILLASLLWHWKFNDAASIVAGVAIWLSGIPINVQ